MTVVSAPSPHFVKPELWAKTNGIGLNAVYEYLRREVDPLPHLKRGSDYHIDDQRAIEWMRRNFGVNTGGDAPPDGARR